MNNKELDKFNVFGECNPPHCHNMRWGGNFSELERFFEENKKELLQIVIEDVPHRYQKRLLEKLKSEELEHEENLSASESRMERSDEIYRENAEAIN